MFKRKKKRGFHPFHPIQDNDEKESLLSLQESHNSKIHILPKPGMEGIINIICGYGGTTYILLEDNTFMIYGYNAFGQLALGHFDYINEPEIPRWSQSYKIKQIFSGISSKHSFIITQNNKIFAVGNNSHKQFGINTNDNTLSTWTEIVPFQPFQANELESITTSEQHTTFLTKTGCIYETDNKLPYIRSIKMKIRFKSIKCGKSHSLAICFNDNIYSWGSNNNFGQLGNGIINENKINSPQIIIFFFKYNIKIKQIECGNDHSLVLTKNNGNVYCFGRNDYYQLGNGLNNPYIVKLPKLNNTLKNEHIIHIKCGGYHNMAKNHKNEYFLWGNNKQNQCLVFDGNVEFVKIPTKYENNHENMKIIGIYLGYKETKIVSKYEREEEISKSSSLKTKRKNNRNLNKLQSKLEKFKKWCTRNKSVSNESNSNDSNSEEIKMNEWTTNDLNERMDKKWNELYNFNYLDRLDEENYYQEEEYINHTFIKHENIETVQEGESKINSVRTIHNDIKYHRVTLEEC